MIAISALALAAAPASAGLYQCAGEKGAVVYQDTACAPGRELRDSERDPGPLSVVPGTPLPGTVRIVTAAEPRPPKAKLALRRASSVGAIRRSASSCAPA
jgi:hypothetical protein